MFEIANTANIQGTDRRLLNLERSIIDASACGSDGVVPLHPTSIQRRGDKIRDDAMDDDLNSTIGLHSCVPCDGPAG